MSSKVSTYAIMGLAGAAVLGSIGYAVWECGKTDDETAIYQKVVKTHETALAAAKAAAREKVRAELRKREVELAKTEGAEAVRLNREKAKKRREAVRRKFFGNGGFKLTSSYAKACEMPEGDPSAADQEIIDLAGELATEADLDTAAEVTDAALKSTDPRARMAAVEMLSALGEVGLSDIGEFLRDEHPEVANLAAERWELGVQDIVNDEERTALVKVGLLAITDEDQLRSMVGTLLLTTDELLVIQTVADVMRDGAQIQKAAVKEAYENVTGEKWKNEKEAEKWLAENYTPPEPEEPGEAEESMSDEEEDEMRQ